MKTPFRSNSSLPDQRQQPSGSRGAALAAPAWPQAAALVTHRRTDQAIAGIGLEREIDFERDENGLCRYFFLCAAIQTVDAQRSNATGCGFEASPMVITGITSGVRKND